MKTIITLNITIEHDGTAALTTATLGVIAGTAAQEKLLSLTGIQSAHVKVNVKDDDDN